MTQHEHSSNVAVVLDFFFMKKLAYATASSALLGHDKPMPANDEDWTSPRTTEMEFAPRNDMATRGSGLSNSLGSMRNNPAATSTSSTSPKLVDFKSTNVNPDLSIVMAMSPSDSYKAGGRTQTVRSSTSSSNFLVTESAYSINLRSRDNRRMFAPTKKSGSLREGGILVFLRKLLLVWMSRISTSLELQWYLRRYCLTI
mmetsp:Transcript_25046/g.54156  ORF Transcript_25046/g.54156 Transcript_25046/m.54156 type:complete len:200 (+) Transcript_25046:1537-2136(+)